MAGSSAASELAALSAVFGARCVDAAALESSVIDRCETLAEDLPRRRQELQHLQAAVARLEATGRSSATSDKATLSHELQVARGRVEALRAEVRELSEKAEAQRAIPLSELGSAQPRQFGYLRSSSSALDLDSSDDDVKSECDDDVKLEVKQEQHAAASGMAGLAMPVSYRFDRGDPPATVAAASSTAALPPERDEAIAADKHVSCTEAHEFPKPRSGRRKRKAPDLNQAVISPKDYLKRIAASMPSTKLKARRSSAPVTGLPELSSGTSSSSSAPKQCKIEGASDSAPPDTTDAKLVTLPTRRSAESLELQVGARVTLSGLTSDLDLNGQEGILEMYRSDTRRWRVRLASGIAKNVRPENLICAADDDDEEDGAAEDDPSEAGEAASEVAVAASGILAAYQPPKAPRHTGPKAAAYHIDVRKIVSKPTAKRNQWSELNPKEYQEMMSLGEFAPPSQNLLTRARFQRKRVAPADDDVAAKKPKAHGDANEKTFERRQALWQLGTMKASDVEALRPKQKTDEAGNIVKSEKSGDMVIKSEAISGSAILPDVEVAEGLRCPKWLWDALYPYQQECLRFFWGLHCESLGGILADEMGLGKTVQVCAYLAALHHSGILQKMRVQDYSLGGAAAASSGGVLIVVPATLMNQWRSELHRWYPPIRVCVMHGISAEERRETMAVACSNNGVLLTSYDTMRTCIETLVASPWVMVILDEGQKIRNPTSAVTVAAKRFSTPHRLILSGSPIQNRLQELWSLFDFICPGRLGTLPVFLEEFADPIEKGSLKGSNQARVSVAYQCALALRELTMPCILKRSKAETLDVLRLPPKQEQVLFCNLSVEQYQVYADFIKSEQVTQAMKASTDRRMIGAAFFAINVLRKICNHPDLLLKDAEPEQQPEDMWNPARSGKMKVLAEIVKLWHKEGHKALIFVQTVQMLEVLQRWLDSESYTYFRMDGKTAINRRQGMIEEFNSKPEIFAMLMTTKVGGVGLNIIGANRVVIFDPDWNPMTDVQARERTWRIGQTRDVVVYRLVSTGAIEEKIYQRQVYKHFLAQKVLNDPRQRQFFKWSDLADLFERPAPPPGFDGKELRSMSSRYKDLYRKAFKIATEEDTNETTDIMQAIQELPTLETNTPEKDTKDEHNAILQTLYDSQGIKTSFNHDKVEQPLLDRKIVRDGAGIIAQRAVQALRNSARDYMKEKASQALAQSGRATSRLSSHSSLPVKMEPKVKLEPGERLRGASTFDAGHASSMDPSRVAHRSGVSSGFILDGLKQLAAIRAAAQEKAGGQTQSEEATRVLQQQGFLTPTTTMKQEGGREGAGAVLSDGAMEALLDQELHESDKGIAEMILHVFLDPVIAGSAHCLTTSQVLEYLSSEIAPHHNDLFKSLLKQLCEFSKPQRAGESGTWTLRQEYWPGAAKLAWKSE
eukprot:TRINITY_DN120743_c0_g1_i1.p1 TRINITY_DN120743_c0_g1~~TRINITY_DN120743_c0_g1_i1.p1  ORF type:complete len:1416 (+),score=301.71 TRINITY_DN120743_c0_g1_i1:77-4324(+)